MPPRRKSADPDTVITYVRVSTEEQRDSGLGLDAQRAILAEECERHGWRVVLAAEDAGISAKNIEGRPGLVEALQMLEQGGAARLVASKLDRLSRSVHDFTGLLATSVRQGWNLVVVDMALDTSTTNGKFMAHIMASVAELERGLISDRTKGALQVKKRAGVQLGRKQRTAWPTVQRVVGLRRDGLPLRTIAEILTEEQVPTSQGGARWYASTVAAVLRRPEAVAFASAVSGTVAS